MIDCTDCGACCRRWPVVVDHTEPVPRGLLEPLGARSFLMRRVDGACVALVDNRCAIYELRPRACRVFEVGAPRCMEARDEQP